MGSSRIITSGSRLGGGSGGGGADRARTSQCCAGDVSTDAALADVMAEISSRLGPMRFLPGAGSGEVVLEDEATPRLEEDEQHEDIDWPTDRQSNGVRKSLLEGIMD